MTYNLDKVGNRLSVVDNEACTPYAPDVINRYTTVGASALRGE